ncbi:MAG: hypothetical protein ACI8W8_000903 [Rhodothermales bacterium]|jgi:hypothetical protein
MNHPDGECPTPEKPAAPKVLIWTVLGATLIVAAFVHFYGHVRLNILTWQGGSGSGQPPPLPGLALLYFKFGWLGYAFSAFPLLAACFKSRDLVRNCLSIAVLLNLSWGLGAIVAWDFALTVIPPVPLSQ